jgi:hypothetical protein
MGEPFVIGSDQVIETSSLTFAVVTVTGGSAKKAHKRVRVSE